MRLPEQKLWDRFRTRLRASRIYAERVENLVVVGMPDVICLKDGRVTWVELKARSDPPAKLDTPILGDKLGLTREQRNWHLHWHQFGGCSIVLVSVGDLTFAIGGQHADVANELTMNNMHERALCVGWDGVMNFLGAQA